MKNEHVCTPRKYDQKGFELKVIPKLLFKLYQNLKGEANKKLIVFTSEKKDFVYEYIWERASTYRCSSCKIQKKQVTAKLNGDNVELSSAEHICKPKKFDQKKYKK